MLSNSFIQLENFEKLEKIGEGGFGKAYKVLNKIDGNIYSAKISFHEDNDFSSEFVKHFFREVNILSLINFPSITKFIGCSPISFNNKPKPTIIFEYLSNGTLHQLLELIRKGENIPEWTDTKKLITLYGIAKALEFLHSNYIIHRDLRPVNILLDDYLFPKISDFGLSKVIKLNPNSETTEETNEVPNTPEYLAPEVLTAEDWSLSADVYSFAMIAYEIMTNERPFSEFSSAFEIVNEVIKKEGRPKFNKEIPDCYRELIECCWSSDPSARPLFREIVETLSNDSRFITEKVDSKEFFDYIKFNFCSEKVDELNKFYESIQKVDIYQNRIKETAIKNISVNIKLIDLNSFELKEQIGEGSYGTVYKVIEKASGDFCAAKISITKINKSSEDKIANLEREVNIISKLDHPSILKFIGFNTYNFKHKKKPTIITEYVTNGSLDKIIEMERKSLSNIDWDDTKKLITIYGIASGMSYLHSHEILHRDLKPGNILLDKYLFPKISDFGLSKELSEGSANHSGYKGTPAYSAPEVFQEKYTKAGDVFSFALIVYEIMTNEVLYSNMNQFQLLSKVCAGYRPSFRYPIASSYEELIKDCWKDDPKERPTFEQIVFRLQTDKGFITSNVDEEEFLNYVCYVDETFERDEQTFQEISIDKNPKKENNSLMNENFLDLNKFEKSDLIMKSDIYKSYKVKSKETGSSYLCKISMIKISNFSKDDLIKLSREVNLISQLNHPSFLKFIGYSPINFKHQNKPVIITEFPMKGSLFNVLEKVRKKRNVLNWNDTKKLIIIYGIASGMSYLHSNNVIHRDLNPKNVFLDDNLYPKLGDFGLSIRNHNVESMTYQSTSGMKGTLFHDTLSQIF